jgi:hypothetical protein
MNGGGRAPNEKGGGVPWGAGGPEFGWLFVIKKCSKKVKGLRLSRELKAGIVVPEFDVWNI